MKFAPRYDRRIIDALRALDDRSVSIAEVNRRVGARVARRGITRPSYVHLRRLVHMHRLWQDAQRLLRAELRAITADVARRLLLGLRVDAYDVGGRVQEARLLADFHPPP